MATPLYWMTGPTSWGEPPTSYSYSSLTAIERCPLQWQLVHSRYGELNRFPARPHPAAEEGEIVHSLLDQLFRAMAFRGMPAIGTPDFQEGVTEVGIHQKVRLMVNDHERLLADHPRASGFRLRTGSQQLANRVIRLFRELYPQAVVTHRDNRLSYPATRVPHQPLSGLAVADLLRERGALSEVTLFHPTLSFSGTIDLVWLDHGRAVIVDFKTGQEKTEHKEQVACYAVLWWRCSGCPPARAEVRYPGRVVTLAVNDEMLAAAEEELTRRLATVTAALRLKPSEARSGEHCRFCDVRQYCDPYWATATASVISQKSSAVGRQAVDLEVDVRTEPSETGFGAQSADGGEMSIVFREALSRIHGPFINGEQLRILGGQVVESGGGLELCPWTEVFHRSAKSLL